MQVVVSECCVQVQVVVSECCVQVQVVQTHNMSEIGEMLNYWQKWVGQGRGYTRGSTFLCPWEPCFEEHRVGPPLGVQEGVWPNTLQSGRSQSTSPQGSQDR